MIENLRPLTQEQRQGARKNARDAVICTIGPKPARDHLKVSASGNATHLLIVPDFAAGSVHAIGDPVVCDWLSDFWSSRAQQRSYDSGWFCYRIVCFWAQVDY